MDIQQTENELQQIGFSPHEAKVYLALLELGSTSTGPIIKQVGLHRNIVYDTLNKLVNKKFVIETNKRGVKQFDITDPSRILQEKENHFHIAQALVPQLASYRDNERVDTVIYAGAEGFRNAHEQAIAAMPKGSTVYVNGAGGERFYRFMGDSLRAFDKARYEKEIDIKIIAYCVQEPELDQPDSGMRHDVTIKYLPLHFSNPTGSSVYGDTVLLFIYADDPTVIELKSKKLAAAYVESFKGLWNIAEK